MIFINISRFFLQDAGNPCINYINVVESDDAIFSFDCFFFTQLFINGWMPIPKMSSQWSWMSLVNNMEAGITSAAMLINCEIILDQETPTWWSFEGFRLNSCRNIPNFEVTKGSNDEIGMFLNYLLKTQDHCGYIFKLWNLATSKGLALCSVVKTTFSLYVFTCIHQWIWTSILSPCYPANLQDAYKDQAGLPCTPDHLEELVKCAYIQ